MFWTFKIDIKTYGHTTFEQEFVLTLKIIANQNNVSNSLLRLDNFGVGVQKLYSRKFMTVTPYQLPYGKCFTRREIFSHWLVLTMSTGPPAQDQ